MQCPGPGLVTGAPFPLIHLKSQQKVTVTGIQRQSKLCGGDLVPGAVTLPVGPGEQAPQSHLLPPPDHLLVFFIGQTQLEARGQEAY